MLSASKRDSPACAIKMLPKRTARIDFIMGGNSGVRVLPGRAGLIGDDDHPALVCSAVQRKMCLRRLLAPGGVGRLGLRQGRSLFVFRLHTFASRQCFTPELTMGV